MNAILNISANNANEVFVDSYDVKQVVRLHARNSTRTWIKCEYEDHTSSVEKKRRHSNDSLVP